MGVQLRFRFLFNVFNIYLTKHLVGPCFDGTSCGGALGIVERPPLTVRIYCSSMTPHREFDIWLVWKPSKPLELLGTMQNVPNRTLGKVMATPPVTSNHQIRGGASELIPSGGVCRTYRFLLQTRTSCTSKTQECQTCC